MAVAVGSWRYFEIIVIHAFVMRRSEVRFLFPAPCKSEVSGVFYMDIIATFWKQGMVLIDLKIVKIVLSKPIKWKKLDADGWKGWDAD